MRPTLPTQTSRLALPGEVEPDYTFDSEPQHFRDYWKIVVKRRRLVAAIFLLVLITGAYFSFTATRLYTATTTLKIEPQNPTVTGVGEILRLNDLGGQYDYHQTQFKLLESRNLAARVITDLQLESNKSFTNGWVTSANPITRIQDWIFGHLYFVVSLIEPLFNSSDPAPESQEPPATSTAKEPTEKQKIENKKPQVSGSSIGLYMSFLEVKPVKNTRLVDVRFTTPNPNLSQQLADAHARGFIRLTLEGRFELTKEARDFLDTKNADLKKKLERSEDALNRFRQAHGVVSMEKGENIVVERLVDLNRQLTQARTRRIDAESLYKVVENKSLQYLSEVISQGMVPNLRANLVGIEAEKAKLSTIFKPDHPRIIELTQQINEARRALNTELSNVVRGIRENYVAATAREESLQAEAQKQQQMALNLKEVGVEYAVLEEEVKVNRALYEGVLKRLNETNISNDIAVSNMQIAQYADTPKWPDRPNIPLNLIVAAMCGLIFGIGLAFLLEYLDSSVNTPQHVWRAVALSTFGVVPDVDSLNRNLLGPNGFKNLLPLRDPRDRLPAPHSSPKTLIAANQPFSIISESYRTIRTALLYSQAEKPPQVLLLTSPSPGEGKTVSSLNLAIALAQDSKRVLVIDADLRRGCCHSRLGMRNHNGLTNVLTGHLILEQGIQRTPVNGLSLLSRGVCPPNPSDLLGSSKMRDVIKSVRESFDFIVIDSPPAIAVSDAAILSVLSDGVLLVFHGKKTTTASARQVLERLDAIRAPVLGVILNGVNLDNPDYAYYRTYYGSDYGNPGGQAPKEDDKTVRGIDRAALSPTAFPDSVVPQTFFDEMIATLSKALGPVAPLIVRDQIVMLGESQKAFPKSRIKELLKRLSQEILNEKLRNDFQRTMQEKAVRLDSSGASTTTSI
jgi:succinoglycan biosynthesis transport protein ExoP